MGMLVQDLFKMGIFKDAELVAGSKGLYNEIVWINMMEILDVLESLQKGELLITTGYGVDDENKYKDLIYKLKEKELAGIGIQPGYYIDDIPSYIIEDGDKLDFPVIKIPEKITFSHITRTIYKELLFIEQGERNQGIKSRSIILDILEGKELDSDDKDYLQSTMWDKSYKEVHLGVFSISHKEDGIIIRSDIDASMNKLLSFFEKNQCKVHFETIKGSIVILFCHHKDVCFNKLYIGLDNVISSLSGEHPNLLFTFGLASSLADIEKIGTKYYEALSIKHALEKMEAVKGLYKIEDMELLNFLSGYESKEKLIEFMDNTLNKILNYDNQNKSNYLETLKYYLNNKCSINNTSRDLYIHRHTLRYRLERIEKLCDIDFMNFKSRLKYELAVLIYDLYM